MLRAIALVAGPLLFAAVFFQLRAPGGSPGVYVEVQAGDTRMHALPGYAVKVVPAPADVTANTPATPDGIVRSFFIVDAEKAGVAVSPASTTLTFFVVNSADESLSAEPLVVPVTIRQVNPRVYRVTSDDLGPKSRAYPYLQQVLSRTPGSRATMDLVAGLVLQDTAGQRRMHSVRFGPGR